jgi:DNA mismatch repair ATPase MutS
MLRAWLCRPLCDIGQIERRLDAVEELCQRTDLVDAFTQELRRYVSLLQSPSLARAGHGHGKSATFLPYGATIFLVWG